VDADTGCQDRGVVVAMKKRLGLKYSTMNNHFVKGQRVPSQKYKENYDRIKWDNYGSSKVQAMPKKALGSVPQHG